MAARSDAPGFDPEGRTNPFSARMTDGEYEAHIAKVVAEAPPLPRKVVELLRAAGWGQPKEQVSA